MSFPLVFCLNYTGIPHLLLLLLSSERGREREHEECAAGVREALPYEEDGSTWWVVPWEWGCEGGGHCSSSSLGFGVTDWV